MQVASPFVCTSPLAVIAVTAVLEIRTVSNCAEFKSFQLSMDIAAPESTINCLSSGFVEDRTGIHQNSLSEKKVAFSVSLSFKILLANLQTSSQAHRSCYSVSS